MWGEPLTGPKLESLGVDWDTQVRTVMGQEGKLLDFDLSTETPFYCLREGHEAYIVRKHRGFVCFNGEFGQPIDWDGKLVLYRNGKIGANPRINDWIWFKDNPQKNIIGYTIGG